MQAGEAGFADGVKTGHIGLAVFVDHNAAAGVVGGGHHRHGVTGDIQAQLQTLGVDGGEVLDNEIRRLVADIQIQTVRPQALHFMVDGAGHHVPGGQFSAFIKAMHEALTAGQQQVPTFAANGLGDQKTFGLGVVQAGGVELHEFHVGHPAAGPPGHGDAVAGGHIRIGRIQVDLGGAAGGQHHGSGQNDVGFAGLDIVHIGAAAALFFAFLPVGAVVLLQDQVHGHPIFEAGHVVFFTHLADQGAGDGLAGGVGGMNDAAVAVPALTGQVVGQGAVVIAGQSGEIHPQIDQPADRIRAVFHRVTDRVIMAQATPGHVRIGHVTFQGIFLVQHRGDAALGVIGAGAGQLAFGQQGDPAIIGQAQGGG